MKIKNNILALACLFIFNYSFATDSHITLRERTENWLKKAPADTNNGESSSGRIGVNKPTADPNVPLGDSLFVCLLLSGIYIAFLSRKYILTTCSIRTYISGGLK